jgi:hypothetical protein
MEDWTSEAFFSSVEGVLLPEECSKLCASMDRRVGRTEQSCVMFDLESPPLLAVLWQRLSATLPRGRLGSAARGFHPAIRCVRHKAGGAEAGVAHMGKDVRHREHV